VHFLVAAGCGGLAEIWETWSLADYLAQLAVYAELGPPAFVTLAAQAGFKPPPRARAAERLEGDDLVNFLAAFPDGG